MSEKVKCSHYGVDYCVEDDPSLEWEYIGPADLISPCPRKGKGPGGERGYHNKAEEELYRNTCACHTGECPGFIMGICPFSQRSLRVDLREHFTKRQVEKRAADAPYSMVFTPIGGAPVLNPDPGYHWEYIGPDLDVEVCPLTEHSLFGAPDEDMACCTGECPGLVFGECPFYSRALHSRFISHFKAVKDLSPLEEGPQEQ